MTAPIDPSTLHSKYLAHYGFVTTPRYFDDVVQQFLAVAPTEVGARAGLRTLGLEAAPGFGRLLAGTRG